MFDQAVKMDQKTLLENKSKFLQVIVVIFIYIIRLLCVLSLSFPEKAISLKKVDAKYSRCSPAH